MSHLDRRILQLDQGTGPNIRVNRDHFQQHGLQAQRREILASILCLLTLLILHVVEQRFMQSTSDAAEEQKTNIMDGIQRRHT